jgi:outer membrane lipoprotein SlyB
VLLIAYSTQNERIGMAKNFLIVLIVIAFTAPLAGCAHPGQNTYGFNEVGQVTSVEFGRVVDIQPIDIKGPNTGTGATVGALAGAGVGSQIGQGNGSIAAAIGGLVIGAVAGAVAEQSMQDSKGLLYTITLRSGKTITVTQYQNKTDPVIKVGQRVMVQTSGQFQRVMPASHLPEKIKKPKDIQVVV